MLGVAEAAPVRRVLTYSSWDALLIVLAITHGVVLVAVPHWAVISLGLWWNSNTISHNFVHKPFFQHQPVNQLFTCYLTLLLGIPQSLWRQRHLAHHASLVWRWCLTPVIFIELILVLSLWSALLAWQPAFFVRVYLPGYLAGLALCFLQGHGEHFRGTLSHYGWLYNRMFFNDGYHVEHHYDPQTHWTDLPRAGKTGSPASHWPAVLRWLEWINLDSLEKCVVHSKLLQWFVLRTHERAFRRLLPYLSTVNRVAVVGGGLFPRTVLILQRLLPGAHFVVIDARPENIQTARALLHEPIEWLCEWYNPAGHTGFDLVVIPLSFARRPESPLSSTPSTCSFVPRLDLVAARHEYCRFTLPVEAVEPGEVMRALSLLGVCILAKICVLAGRDLPLSAWSPIAYLWQDLLIVLLFAALDSWMQRPWLAWALYAILVTYLAVNVPVARELSTPLTWPLLRAAGTPLADSIWSYVNRANLLLLLLIVAAASGLPLLARKLLLFPRVSRMVWQGWRNGGRISSVAQTLAAVMVLVCLGPIATQHVETLGLHRNAVAALFTTVFPRLPPRAEAADWRASPFPMSISGQLSGYHGAAAGRNLVLVSLESTAASYLRSFGAAEDPMPHLTELARQSILFENAYAVYPESIKGLYSVLCSSYPAIHTSPETYERVPCDSLAEKLGQSGYRTGLFHSGRFGYLGMESIVRRRGFDVLEDAGQVGGDHNSSFGVDEPSTVKRILSWLDSLPAGERFFVTYLPIAGHHPYATPGPGPFPQDNARSCYLNSLYYADQALELLIDGLRERGLDQNTTWVIFGDHGEAFGQHEGNFGHTLSVYEENVHVPLLIAVPGLTERQVRVSGPASLLDVAPTVLDLLGFALPSSYQGESLLTPRPRMALFFTDYTLGLLGLRDHHWKLIHEMDSGRSKLFDLRLDPAEQFDLSSQYPDRVSAYRAHLLRWCGYQRDRVSRGRSPA